MISRANISHSTTRHNNADAAMRVSPSRATAKRRLHTHQMFGLPFFRSASNVNARAGTYLCISDYEIGNLNARQLAASFMQDIGLDISYA